MTSVRTLLLSTAVILMVLVPDAGAGRLTADQWRADLAALDNAIRTDHKSPFHTVGEADYATMVETLHRRIPELSDQEIIVGLASIVAAINDGHTRLTGWHRNAEWGFHSYPLTLYWFADGLFVRQAHPDHADLVGAKVLQVGHLSAEEAQARIEQVVPADNRYGEREEGPSYLTSPEVLRALGIMADADAPYVLERDGRTWTPQLEPLDGQWPGSVRGFVSADWPDASDAAAGPEPQWRRHADQAFWFEYLEAEKILYVQQNQVLNSPSETLESFYARVWRAFEQNDVEKLVLDVRLNGGGNNYLNKPAVTTMVRADASAQTYTILGRRTFSACQNLVNELSRWTDTIFVGEPTGERANFYGDTRATELPNSGLTARVSFLWWQNLDPRNLDDALYPDLSAEMSSSDYAANHDPAMHVIRTFSGPLRVEEILDLADAEGLQAALGSLRDMLANPAFAGRNLESEINDAGYRLAGQGRIADAISVFQLNVDAFPDSWNVYDSLAEAYLNQGDLDRARSLYEKSLAINPQSPTGLAAMERLTSESAGGAVHRH